MTSIAAFGAGNTGCHVDGRLAVAGSPVALADHPQISTIFTTQGFALSGYHDWTARALPAHIAFSTEACAAAADRVLITGKSADTKAAALALKPYLKPSAFASSL